MVLRNVWIVGAGKPVDIRIGADKITQVSDTDITDGPLALNFNNVCAFPGLVNSHDHLDFNLFPALGDKVYKNYTEWGTYIHANYKDEIRAVLKVPLLLREQWGIIKNLLCGVTTVLNHGERVSIEDPLICVHEKYQCLHSIRFEKRWKIKLNKPFKAKLPVVVHVGEGIDMAAHVEIDQLTKWNILKKDLVGVHAVAMTELQAEKFKAIVWCPRSNYFLLDRTAPVDRLKAKTKILFGTDSTLTGDGNIWDHIRLARETKMLSDDELYKTLNNNAADVWGLNCRGIKADCDADLFLVKKKDGESALGTFFETVPEDILLVIQQGSIRLFDEKLLHQLEHIGTAGYSKFYMNGVCKYVEGDVPGLMMEIHKYYPEAQFPVTAN